MTTGKMGIVLLLGCAAACTTSFTARDGGEGEAAGETADAAREEAVDATAADGREDTGEGADAPVEELGPGCPNGTVETGEECDDGNRAEGDGCDNDCTYSCHGSGECDDGDPCDGDETCSVRHVCEEGLPLGDGTGCGTDPRRICVAAACVASSCGDGYADPVEGEECDDGADGDPADGCRDDCSWTCEEATGAADCDDGRVCTDDLCAAASHTCMSLPRAGGALCRAAAGVCDVEERCDGSAPDCPADAFPGSAVTCRAAAGQCDAAEVCTGTGAGCPADAFRPSTAPCDDGSFCTWGDVCSGTGDQCAGTGTNTLFNALSVAAGDNALGHACAVLRGGAVKCWGYNDYGKVGDGTTTTRLSPVSVVGLSSGAAGVGAGNRHTCALTAAGGAMCWGWNTYGQVGDGTNVDRWTPVAVVGLAGARGISVGDSHACVVTSAGGVKCWGYNGGGQLGDHSSTDRATPVNVSGLGSGVAAVSCGGAHTCALTSAGGAKCWGANSYGQLGNGTTTGSTTPVNVSTLTSGVAAVSAGSSGFACAVTAGGAAKCWGNNDYGQLGNGTTAGSPVPLDVSGLGAGVVAVAAGSFHACALTAAGGVKCWGEGSSGALGNGSFSDHATPVNVSGLSAGAAAVESGNNFTCAILSTGQAVKCWGENGRGQLGNRYTTDRSSPADVSCQ